MKKEYDFSKGKKNPYITAKIFPTEFFRKTRDYFDNHGYSMANETK